MTMPGMCQRITPKCCFKWTNFIQIQFHPQIILWARFLRPYSDWLRAGRSGDQIPVEARFSTSVQTGPWGPPSFLYNGHRVFSGGKERPGRDSDPSPPTSTVGHKRVELCLYFLCGPYGLYRASVPVQG
jgi:hypothetical protein